MASPFPRLSTQTVDAALFGADEQQFERERQLRMSASQTAASSQTISPEADRRSSTMATATKLPEISRIKTNQNGFINSGLKKTVYLQLVKERDDLNLEVSAVNKLLCESNQTNAGLTQQIQTLTLDQQTNMQTNTQEMNTKNTLIDTLNASNQEKTKQIQEKDAEIKKLEDQVKTYKQALADAVQALKDAGKHAKSEQSKDVGKKIADRLRYSHYRTVKFVRDEDLTELTKAIYIGIQDELTDENGHKMSESEFVRIYQSCVQEKLGDRRQYTQTQLQDAMLVWYNSHNSMPPLEWFDDPYHVPEERSQQHDKRLQFLVWYWNTFLPAAAGVENFPKDIVNYRMPIQPLSMIPGMEGKKGPMVTISSEAFALVVVRNCWDKWTCILPEKVKDSKWKVPSWNKEDTTTHKYHKTLWSDGRNGQKKGQGWTPDGYLALNEKMDSITKYRQEQKTSKPRYAKYKAALKAVKKANNVPLDEKDPPAKGRKRKRSTEPAPVYAKITLEEEEDEEWVDDDDSEDNEE